MVILANVESPPVGLELCQVRLFTVMKTGIWMVPCFQNKMYSLLYDNYVMSDLLPFWIKCIYSFCFSGQKNTNKIYFKALTLYTKVYLYYYFIISSIITIIVFYYPHLTSVLVTSQIKNTLNALTYITLPISNVFFVYTASVI